MALPILVFIGRKLQITIVRHEMEERLERDQLITIEVPTGSVYWYKPGKEIIVDGRMFDVKSWKAKGDSILFTGLFDDEELAIKTILENFSKAHTQSTSQHAQKYFGFVWLHQQRQPADHASYNVITRTYNPCRVFVHQNPFIIKFSPPPRITC